MELMGWELPAQGPADIAMGIVAFVVSLAMFFYPLPTFWNIWRKKRAGGLEPYPFMAVFVNCFMLLMYSVARRSDVSDFKYGCLLYSNQIGMLMINFYLLAFWKYNEEITMNATFAIGSMYGLFFLFFIIPPWWRDVILPDERYFAQMAMVTAIIMYISPMFPIVRAYRAKRVECLPFWLCITIGLYGLAWTTYAFVPPTYEIYFTIGNGIGTILLLFQLGVCCVLFVAFRNRLPTQSAGFEKSGANEPLLK